MFCSQTLTPAKRTTRRIAELPSLRYGSIGSKTIKSGPLRVTSSATIPRKSNGKLDRTDQEIDFKPSRPVSFHKTPGHTGCFIYYNTLTRKVFDLQNIYCYVSYLLVYILCPAFV